MISSRPWSPVAERERVFTLDALRGFAIFGVVVANVLTFAFPAWQAPSAAGAEGAQMSRLLFGFLVEGKFYVLFAILFGMGLALQSARAEASSRPFASVYARRLGSLLLLGFAHGGFLYSGDILAFYAVLGLIAMPLRRLPRPALLTLALALLLTNVIVIGVYAAHHPGSVIPTVPDWEQLADERRAVLPEPPREDEAGAPEQDGRLDFLETMADESRIFQSGSWREMTRHRAFAYTLVGWPCACFTRRGASWGFSCLASTWSGKPCSWTRRASESAI